MYSKHCILCVFIVFVFVFVFVAYGCGRPRGAALSAPSPLLLLVESQWRAGRDGGSTPCEGRGNIFSDFFICFFHISLECFIEGKSTQSFKIMNNFLEDSLETKYFFIFFYYFNLIFVNLFKYFLPFFQVNAIKFSPKAKKN